MYTRIAGLELVSRRRTNIKLSIERLRYLKLKRHKRVFKDKFAFIREKSNDST